MGLNDISPGKGICVYAVDQLAMILNWATEKNDTQEASEASAWKAESGTK